MRQIIAFINESSAFQILVDNFKDFARRKFFFNVVPGS